MAKTIHNNIRRLRFDRKEMTQQELADKIGVTRQTVNAIELGKYSPSLEVAFRIADVFGVPARTRCFNTNSKEQIMRRAITAYIAPSSAPSPRGRRCGAGEADTVTGTWTLSIERSPDAVGAGAERRRT